MPQVRFKAEPYTCVRCGYTTLDKTRMNTHFNRKHTCPGSHNDIELTDEVKQCILTNRIYNVPKPSSQNNTINNYNTINNFVVNLDPINKLNSYINYKEITLISLERQIETRYLRRNSKMRERQGFHEVSNKDLYDAITSVTRCSCSHFTDYNVVYDSKVSKLMIRDNNGDWLEYTISKGVSKIVEMLKEFHLDNYEQYLIRMIEEPCGPNLKYKQKFTELIREYYSLLVCFELEPYVHNATEKIVQSKDSSEMMEKYMAIYNSEYDTTTIRKQRQLKTELVQTIKSNGKSNIKDLNEHLLHLIQGDSNFKDVMMSSYKSKSITF